MQDGKASETEGGGREEKVEGGSEDSLADPNTDLEGSNREVW